MSDRSITASANNESSPPYALACTEVWGGNRRGARLVDLAGMAAWIYSNPLGWAEAGGDLHYLSVCNLGVLTRVALADVSGHGYGVSALADQLHGLMREYIETWDQSAFVKELNLAFHQGAASGTYATLVVLGYYRSKGQLVFTNAGHLPPLWYHYEDRSWGWLEESRSSNRGQIAGLPIGLIRGTDYRQTVVTLAASDILVLYTDGITEARNGSGGELGRERLREWVRDLPVDSPAAVGEGLLDRLTSFRHGPPGDDETLIVLQRLRD